MKYFQSIADIKRHYDTIVCEMEKHEAGNRWSLALLETWNISLEERDQLEEEREVLNYLLSCQFTFARGDNAQKPTVEVANRCFSRQLTFLENIHHCDVNTWRNYKNPLVKKEYLACRHYLFQFSLPAWYRRLPDKILSFENKYSNLEQRRC